MNVQPSGTCQSAFARLHRPVLRAHMCSLNLKFHQLLLYRSNAVTHSSPPKGTINRHYTVADPSIAASPHCNVDLRWLWGHLQG
jgi:hypothetical protein